MRHVVTEYSRAREVYRCRELRQALYDAGDVVMADVLVNLHGDAHTARRRLENRLYDRETLTHYERDLFPSIVESTLIPHALAGRAELVSVGHQLMMNLAATAAGVDRPEGTPEETGRLHDYLKVFIEGATLAHFTGDRQAKAAEVAVALAAFDDEFLAPSIARRRAALAGDGPVPRDVLSALLANDDGLHLPREVVRREVAFYLLAGAHTSATAFVRVTHNVLTWLATHPGEPVDLAFVASATAETVRLEPSSPIALRRAETAVSVAGLDLAPGDEVEIDLLSVNRDPAVFGSDAAEFDPHRPAPDGGTPWGLSFGHGMHHCIGQDLSIGVTSRAGDRLWGLVPVSVDWLFEHGCRPDPTAVPERDATTARPYFARYPVLLG